MELHFSYIAVQRGGKTSYGDCVLEANMPPMNAVQLEQFRSAILEGVQRDKPATAAIVILHWQSMAGMMMRVPPADQTVEK